MATLFLSQKGLKGMVQRKCLLAKNIKVYWTYSVTIYGKNIYQDMGSIKI